KLMNVKIVGSAAALICALLSGCGSNAPTPRPVVEANVLALGPAQRLGDAEKNHSTPFLRYSPDGRLFAVWTEDHETPWPNGSAHAAHQGMMGDRGPSPMRNAMLAWSS